MRLNSHSTSTTAITISVIVASYNKADTLPQCLDSLLTQSANRMEIIVIDDASKDDSAIIARSYAQKYPNKIRFIQNEKNQGLGAVENLGVSIASGQYIGFVDADDYIDKDFYQKLYTKAIETDADVICGDFVIVQEKQSSPSLLLGADNLYCQLNNSQAINSSHANHIIPGEAIAGYWGGSSSCTKLIKKEKLQQFPFFEGLRCDDLPAVLPICAASKVAYAKGAYYYYVQSSGSMERNSSLSTQLDAFTSIALTLERFQKQNAAPTFSQLLIAHSFTSVACSILSAASNANTPDLYFQICEKIEKSVNAKVFASLLNEKENPYLHHALETTYAANAVKYRQILQNIQCYFNEHISHTTQSSTDLPLVSVVIPVYNGSNYLHEAIDSALKQTYPNLEIIVVNDGSRDAGATDLIARSYGDRIRYFRKPNGGVASALNEGIRQMRGEYFSWLSHDDLYAPDKISKEVAYLFEKNKKGSVVFTGYKTIDPHGAFIEEYHIPPRVHLNPKCLLTLDITYTMNGCALLIPKALFDACGLFDTKLKYTQDYDMWLRMTDKTEFLYLDECLMYSRQHPQQDSKTAGIAVTDEADYYHARSIQKLCPNDIATYIDNDHTLLQLFQAYSDAGFPGTAASILALSVRTLKAQNKSRELFQLLQEVCGICAESVLDTLSLMDNVGTKPVLTVYSNIWIHGGIERVLSVLLPEFTERFKVILISAPYEDMEGFPLPTAVTHIRIPYNHSTKLEHRLGCLSILFNTSIFWGNPNIMPMTLPVYRVLKNNGIKSIAHNHYYFFFPYFEPAFHEVCENRHEAFKYADIALWLTNYSAAACLGRNSNVALMPNPVSLQKRPEPLQRKKKLLLAIGRFYDVQKRLDRILDVFAKVHQNDPETRLIVVGGYSLSMDFPNGRTINTILASHQLDSNAVVFVGEVKDPRPYYEEACGLLMASDSEGFPMVIAEAGEHGVPTFVYDTPCMEDLITDGINGLINYEPEIDLLSQRIVRLLNDEDVMLQMSTRSYEMAQRFSKEKVVQKWHELFDILLSHENESIEHKISKSTLIVSSSIPTQSFSYGIQDALRAGSYISRSTNTSPLFTNTEISQLTQNVNQLTQELNLILNSKSWRITKPLRWAHRAYDIYRQYGFREMTIRILRKVKKKLFT